VKIILYKSRYFKKKSCFRFYPFDWRSVFWQQKHF